MPGYKFSISQIVLRHLLLGLIHFILAGPCLAGSGVICRLVDVDIQFDGLDLLRQHDVHGRGFVSATCENLSEKMQSVELQVYDENPSSHELAREPSSAKKLVVSLFVDEALQIRVADQPENIGALRQKLALRPGAVSLIKFPFFVRLHTRGMLMAGVYEKQSGFLLRYSLIDAEK